MAPSIVELYQDGGSQSKVYQPFKTPATHVRALSSSSDEDNCEDVSSLVGTRTNHSTIYPDGSPKTTGQHPPEPDQLFNYDQFPKIITGPTIWRAEDYSTHSERWTYPFSASEIEELSAAADQFISSGTSPTKITSQQFPLSSLTLTLAAIRAELLNGRGFVLFKNLPVDQWPREKTAVAYLGLGSYIGRPVAQNGKGHVLGHVKDLGEDSKATDKVRIYRTNARQFFHTDDCDVVGLLCLAKAEFGGESDVASAHQVWNVLQDEFPDVAELFTRPIWYFDRKGEISEGQDPFIKTAVYFLEPSLPQTTITTTTEQCSSKEARSPPQVRRVYSKFDPYYLISLLRYSSTGLIPPLSAAQLHAISTLEQVCQRVKLHMILDKGDIQFLSNSHVFHARTEYRDFPAASRKPKRHLMRLWLSTPRSEGGWATPFWDDNETKRQGIQVDDVPEVVRFDAD